MMVSQEALYSAVDATLAHYGVDAAGVQLHSKGKISLPARLQYAWPHPTLPVLYCSTSNGGPRVSSAVNPLVALDIASDGSLTPKVGQVNLPERAVHTCVDPGGRWIVNAHNFRGGRLSVHRLEKNGAFGPPVPQPENLECGIYPHQVRIFPSGKTVLIVDRGNTAHGGKSEDPGALRTFSIEDGVLGEGQVVAPNGGYGFGPRHVDFHPTKRWIYVSDERTNKLYMFGYDETDRIDAEPTFVLETLRNPDEPDVRQIAGPIHVDPKGRAVYVVNRADRTEDEGGEQLFAGGENNIAVFAIDAKSGEPILIQHVDTASFHVRTFACDSSGLLLVTASIKGMHFRAQNGEVEHTPAALSLFRIEDDGQLTLVSRRAVETTGNQLQYWMGLA